jgi:hypothetical protein
LAAVSLLPLELNGVYASGLTVYMGDTFRDVIGIVAHGSTDLVFGEAEYEEEKHDKNYHGQGIPIHLELKRGEYLASAWVHKSMSGERLAVSTDLPPHEHSA